ncbi:MAG: T9SS type A sorting domain-containing protein [Bacteroidota bacterium]
MKKFTLLLLFSSFFSYSFLNAQVSCDYSLRLSDRLGDSWNGAVLLLTINEEAPQAFFLLEEDGLEATFPFIITEGDNIQLEYFSGSFDSEVSYALLDAEGNEVFSDGPIPESGIVFEGTAVCPACPAPPISEINFDNIRAEFVEVSWLAPDPDGSYIIRYDTAGFELEDTLGLNGLVLTIMGDEIRIGDLEEKTFYELYIASACANGDTSQFVGPVLFETVFKNDVGVVAIPNPVSDCGLMPVEEIEVTLQNFGANPQSLIPFSLSINDVPVPISVPTDGIFTGVIGKDSTFTTKFDIQAPVGDPNRYEIKVWTDLETDSDMSNDTFTTVVLSIPLVEEYPYFTNLENGFDGWRVDEENSVNSSWEVGTPNFGLLNSAASGSTAWVTRLDTTYNNDELSYLLSPCYDFSALTEDPVLSFSYFVSTESFFDQAWVELSLDGGEIWTKVVASEDARNWYNDTNNQWWDGNGSTDADFVSDWQNAASILLGAAGASDARIRFVFSSDIGTTADGFGVDNIFVSPPLQNDLAGISVRNTSEEECGEARDEVEFTLSNFGTMAQSNFDISYQVNGGEIFTEPFTGTLAPGASSTIIFQDPFNSSTLDEYEILAWTSSDDEQFLLNDTASFVFRTINDIPFLEDFESGALPEGWSVTDENVPVTDGHGAPSFVLSDNLWNTDPFFEATSPVFGLIETGDSLTFDYRYVNFGLTGDREKILNSGDSLIVQLSRDCGDSYETVLKIDSTNHVTSENLATQTIYLEDYVGASIKLRFIAFWGSGDYFLDIDNISVLRCPDNLGLVANVQDESRSGAADGSISVDPGAGIGPFTYKWDNGATTKGISMLEGGTYMVTVSDAFGCTDEITIELETTTATEDISVIENLSLSPNPTQELADLKVDFAQPTTVEVLLFNALGQQIQRLPIQRLQQLHHTFDFSAYMQGLYFVQIRVEEQVYTERLLFLKE